VTGGGEISVPGGFANFGFVAQNNANGPSGQLEYQNHARNLNVHSISITSVSVSTNTATFSGTCTKNGAGVFTFTVNVQDNGEPGTSDQFIIMVQGEPTEGGTITKGNIQIHQAVAQNLGDRSTDCDSAVALAGCSSTTGSHSGRLAQLWNYVRSALWLTPRVT
jgi:hypothetical protein